jgi:hypothetical protein
MRVRPAILTALCLAASLNAQEAPQANRVVWLAIFPDPLPDGKQQLGLEMSTQFLRPDQEIGDEGRTFARMDGEDWQITWDWATDLGKGRLNLRSRLVDRSGGVADQFIASWHQQFGMDGGGRNFVPKYRLAYHLERDGIVAGHLEQPRTQIMDLDLAYIHPLGDERFGGRLGLSLQLPTGRREDFSGSGSTDLLAGAAAWKRWGGWRIHGQGEMVWIGLTRHSPYRAVLGQHRFGRGWIGGGWQGQDRGLLTGLGLDITFAYCESPYRVGIPRIDNPGLQQTWTFTHRALPAWRIGFSEEAGSFLAPDFTVFVSYQF